MKVSTYAEVDITGQAVDVFALATDITSIEKFFKGYGPIPATLEAKVIDEHGRQEAGATRQIRNADGSVIDEMIHAIDPPNYHKYELIRGFEKPFSLLVNGGGGEWIFEQRGPNVHIRWDYHFKITSFLVWPIAVVIMKFFFRKAMEATLARMKLAAEEK